MPIWCKRRLYLKLGVVGFGGWFYRSHVDSCCSTSLFCANVWRMCMYALCGMNDSQCAFRSYMVELLLELLFSSLQSCFRRWVSCVCAILTYVETTVCKVAVPEVVFVEYVELMTLFFLAMSCGSDQVSFNAHYSSWVLLYAFSAKEDLFRVVLSWLRGVHIFFYTKHDQRRYEDFVWPMIVVSLLTLVAHMFISRDRRFIWRYLLLVSPSVQVSFIWCCVLSWLNQQLSWTQRYLYHFDTSQTKEDAHQVVCRGIHEGVRFFFLKPSHARKGRLCMTIGFYECIVTHHVHTLLASKRSHFELFWLVSWMCRVSKVHHSASATLKRIGSLWKEADRMSWSYVVQIFRARSSLLYSIERVTFFFLLRIVMSKCEELV